MTRLIFPDDEMTLGTEAMVDFLDGRQAQAIARIKELAPRIGQRTSDAAVAVMEQLGPLLQKADDPDAEIGLGDLLVCYGQLVRTIVLYGDVFTATHGTDMLLSWPNHPVLRRLMSKRNGVVMALTLRRYNKLAEDMLEVAEGNPVDFAYGWPQPATCRCAQCFQVGPGRGTGASGIGV